MTQKLIIPGGESKEQQSFIGRIPSWITDSSLVRDQTSDRTSCILEEPESGQVLHMPNRYSADYREWEEHFNEYIDKIEDELILIGHSLGASFLIKYLNENPCIKERLEHAYLISGVYVKNQKRTFGLNPEARGLNEIDFTAIHGTADKVVPYSNLGNFQEDFPEGEFKTLEGVGHAIGEISNIIRI